MEKILKVILTTHDELSKLSVFGDTDEDRQTSFIKAEAIRELIETIGLDVIPENQQDQYHNILNEHFEAMAKGLFYKRKLTFNE